MKHFEEVREMRTMKNERGQGTVELVALMTVVLIGLVLVLNGPFKTAIDKTFNAAAKSVDSVGGQLASQSGD